MLTINYVTGEKRVINVSKEFFFDKEKRRLTPKELKVNLKDLAVSLGGKVDKVTWFQNNTSEVLIESKEEMFTSKPVNVKKETRDLIKSLKKDLENPKFTMVYKGHCDKKEWIFNFIK